MIAYKLMTNMFGLVAITVFRYKYLLADIKVRP